MTHNMLIKAVTGFVQLNDLFLFAITFRFRRDSLSNIYVDSDQKVTQNVILFAYLFHFFQDIMR